jgi:Ca2+-binding EF-hand superfamily protein
LNKDGALTKDELVNIPDLGNSFAKYDTNGDGKLSASEYAKYAASKPQVARNKSDTDQPEKH